MGTLLCSYNIMRGCFDSYEETSKLTERFEKLKKGLKKINADFVGLVDTFKWADIFTTEDLQKHFGYKNNFLININDERIGKAVGVAVMTNLDVISFKIITAYNRNFIKTTLDLDSSQIDIYTIYLDDLSENTRLKQIKALLKQIKHPAIIHGDFNSLDTKDISRMKDREESFIKNNKELAKKFTPIINDMKRGKVVKTIKKEDFIDVFREYTPTIPSPLFPGDVKEPIFRVDYFFNSKSIKLISPMVYKNDVFNEISDHYPISVTLDA